MFTFLPGPFLVQFSGPFYLSTDSKETADQIINKRYNIFSVFDSYQPPLPTFQNEI